MSSRFASVVKRCAGLEMMREMNYLSNNLLQVVENVSSDTGVLSSSLDNTLCDLDRRPGSESNQRPGLHLFPIARSLHGLDAVGFYIATQHTLCLRAGGLGHGTSRKAVPGTCYKNTAMGAKSRKDSSTEGA